MLKVTIGTQTERKTVMVPEETTVRQALEDENIMYQNSQVHLNGDVLSNTQLDDSFAKLECSDTALLAVVVKTTNNS